MTPEQCKGCSALYQDTKECTYKDYGIVGKIQLYCPCGTCLVKTLCDYECKLFDNFLDENQTDLIR